MKRLIDITVALLLIVLSTPVVAVALLLIWIDLGSPVIYIQERTGRSMKTFRLYKLRTMVEDVDSAGIPIVGTARAQGIGRVLRRMSLDELPQLLNVLRGELSLVGPRPLMTRYDPWFTERERMRFAVRPGLTGLAQVAGRNSVAWNKRLELDVQYVTDWSLLLDLRIAVRTLGMVFTGRGVALDPQAIMQDLDQERERALVS